MASFDRTRIVDLLKARFPELEQMTGAEIQAFLNEKAGTAVTDSMPNGTAFDMWRQALAKQWPELWPYTVEHVSKIHERTRVMLEETPRK